MRWWWNAKRDAELERELRADLELEEEEQRENGVAEDEARYAALRAFGNPGLIREQTHAEWSGLWLESMWRDFGYAVRRLMKVPGFTVIVVLTLALGMGANIAIFTLVQGFLLRSLPVSDPSRLYRIGSKVNCCYFGSFENEDGEFNLFSYDLYRRFQDSAPEFEQLAAVEAGGGGFSMRWGTAPAQAVRSEYVSGNYFSTLGVGAYRGRPLSPSDDQPNAAPVVVLSYAAWQRQFGGDSGVVGSTVYLEQKAVTVVGVAPPGFFGDRISPMPPEMWLPLSTEPFMEGGNSALQLRGTAWLYAIGRLRPGVALGPLQAKLSGVLRQWMFAMPGFTEHGGAALIPKQHVVLSPAGGGIQKVQQQTGMGLRILMMLSSVVLLIACANIANLLLVRSMAQRTEIAVRIGLGASRWRIIRQILMESLILSTIGGALGVAIAFFGARAVLMLAFPNSENMPVSANPSWAVLGFAFGVSVLTGLLFAGGPAWISSGAQPAEATRGHNSLARDGAVLPQRLLLIFQLSLSIILLASAFLATQSLYNLEHQRMGVETQHRYAVHLDLQGAGYASDQLGPVYRDLEDGLAKLPGLRRATFARYLPLEGNQWGTWVFVQGRPAPSAKDNSFSDWNRVSAPFLDSIGVPILRGRGFTQDDESGSLPVAIVNEAFVKRFFPGEDHLGKHFGMDREQYSGAFEIVGVMADFILSDTHKEPRPLILRPSGQVYAGYKDANEQAAEASSLYLNRMILQFDHEPADAERVIRAEIARINPNIPVSRVLAYNDVVADNFNQERLLARLTGAFGVLALILASIGVYGVMSYMAARRTSEIGIRMALGASRSGIVALMFRSALWQVLVGLLIGIPAALGVCRMMEHLLYEVKSNDPLAFVTAVAALGVGIAMAAVLPAMRAASVDPIRALRAE